MHREEEKKSFLTLFFSRAGDCRSNFPVSWAGTFHITFISSQYLIPSALLPPLLLKFERHNGIFFF